MSDSSFDPVDVPTNSKQHMVEVASGINLQGKELEEYCLKRGLCTKCAKVKVRRRIIKVFGSNTWEPVTAVKVPRQKSRSISLNTGTGPPLGGLSGSLLGKNRNRNANFESVKVKIESGDDETVNYLVYKGYCIREGCYTLGQAKRLAGCSSIRGIGSGANVTTNQSSWSLGSTKSHESKRGGGNSLFKKRGLLRKLSKKASPMKTDNSPLLRIGEDSSFHTTQAGLLRSRGLSPIPAIAIPATTTGEIGCLQEPPQGKNITNNISRLNIKNDNNDDNDEFPHNDESSIVPSPRVRQNFEHEFSWRGSSTKRYHDSDMSEERKLGIGGFSNITTDSKQSEPIREIIHKTLSSLLRISASPMIHTIDLTGLRFRKSEMEALAEMIKAGNNGTVHLCSLILDNCGINDELVGILGQALYKALFTANNLTSATITSITKINQSTRHAQMCLKSLCLGNNDIGNIGIQALCPYLESIASELETLDLSRNKIEIQGGVTLFNALRRNPKTKIRAIDLSYNLVGELNASNVGVDRKCSPGRQISGQGSGIHGFLSKNKTLKELDLSANQLTDDGIELLFGGLMLAGDRTVVEKLNLGFNRIGDRGAAAISACLWVNQSLKLLELNDNYIGDEGGESLLEAIGNNSTLKEISGMLTNKIGKRSIIVSLRQQLVCDDRETDPRIKSVHSKDRKKHRRRLSNHTNSTYSSNSDNGDIYASTDGSTSTKQTRNTSVNKSLGDCTDDIEGEGGQPFLAGANPLIDLEDDTEDSDIFRLEDNENVSDLSDHDDEDVSESYERVMRDNCDVNGMDAVNGLMETNQEVTHNMYDRMTILNASPLVCFDDKEDYSRRGIRLQDTRLETETIKAAVASYNCTRGSYIEVKEEMATVDNFKAFFCGCYSSILHLSCYMFGKNDLALEDGYGSLEILSLDVLKELVMCTKGALELVFVSSPRALRIGQAFLAAGVKHVVCCQRNEDFRDPLVMEFMESFYTQAAQKETLQVCFETALQNVTKSARFKSMYRITQRFQLLNLLLPEPSLPIFFHRFVPNTVHGKESDSKDRPWINILPPLPEHFLGRETEIFDVLESLQVANCVEVSGGPGCGKECVIAASLGYALQRNKTFSINQVCWIPAPKHAIIEPGSLYSDLVLCCDLIRDSSEDLWDRSEDVLDCRERLAMLLEGAKVVVVIDNRTFSSRGSRAALEKLVNFIVTYTSTAKVVCISTTSNTKIYNSDYSAIKTCRIELGALSFRSAATLFGELSDYISRSNKRGILWTAKEFVELANIPTVSQSKNRVLLCDSKRRAGILQYIGNGIPSETIDAAKNMTRKGFHELMAIVHKPELCICSLGELKSEIKRWNTVLDQAVQDGNYKRSIDLQTIILELNAMRQKFCSLDDLKVKEKEMKLELADAVANRRYDIANELKRKLLVLKKNIIKERRASANRSVKNHPQEVLHDLKVQVDSLADAIEHDDSLLTKEEENKIFDIDCDGHICTFVVVRGDVLDSNTFSCNKNSLKGEEYVMSRRMGMVFWSNEACELQGTMLEKWLINNEIKCFEECISILPALEETRYGSVRCFMGHSVVLDRTILAIDVKTSQDDHIRVPILTVGPFVSPSGMIDALLDRDQGFHRFCIAMLRSCYRSCVQHAHREQLSSLAVYPLVTKTKHGSIYEEALRVAVQTIVEECKFAPGLHRVCFLGMSARESTHLTGILRTMGGMNRSTDGEPP